MTGHKKTIDQLIELYDKVMTFFNADNCGVNFILFYGSLLGYHRNGQFIQFDDDIDVIVPRTCREKLLQYIDTITPNKLNTIRVTLNNNDILQLCIMDEGVENKIGPFDIYFYDEPANSNDILIIWDGNLLFKRCDIFPLRCIIFNGHPIFIPNNPGAILLDLYGRDWNVPKTKNVDYVWEKINTVRKLNSTTITIKPDIMFNWKHRLTSTSNSKRSG
jgi:hypothetical protein